MPTVRASIWNLRQFRIDVCHLGIDIRYFMIDFFNSNFWDILDYTKISQVTKKSFSAHPQIDTSDSNEYVQKYEEINSSIQS